HNGDVAIVIERTEIPLRILEDDEPEVVAGDRKGLRTAGHRCPSELAARLEPGKHHLAGPRVFRAPVDLARGLDLRGRQTRRRFLRAALNDTGIDPTLRRVLDQAVLHAVQAA